MSEEEGGAEDVSFLRTEDMVTLSCTGTGERVCLSAEGFGNRQCFLESIADKNVPPDLSQCVFVIEQALSVRALQEIISSNDAEAGKGLGSGHKTLLYGNAILLRHCNSDMYLACLSSSSSNDKLAFDVGLQEQSEGPGFVQGSSNPGEACWWTVHPASKQRSEGEKVRVGDDVIFVSVATERYLQATKENNQSIVNASFHVTQWNVSPFGTGLSRLKNQPCVFGGDVLRFTHGGDECLTIPSNWSLESPETNIVVYEGGSVMQQARSLWRLELARTKWAGGYINWYHPMRIRHITTGLYLGVMEDGTDVRLLSKEEANLGATSFYLRDVKDDNKVLLEDKDLEIIGVPNVRYDDVSVIAQHIETGYWLSYKAYQVKKKGVGLVEEKRVLLHEEGRMDDGCEFARSQEEEARTARVIKKCSALFNSFISGLEVMVSTKSTETFLSDCKLSEMVGCLDDLNNYFVQPEDDLSHEERQKFLKALRNRQDLFQEEGILNLILDMIDKMNVITSQGLLSSFAGEEAGDQWESISASLFQLLAAVIRGNHTNCSQFAQAQRLNWLFSKLGGEGAGMMDVLYCVLNDSPEALNMMQEEHIKVIISLLEKFGRDPKVLDILCNLCKGSGVAVRSSQNNIVDFLLPGKNLLLYSAVVDHVASSRPNMFVGSVPGSNLYSKWYFEVCIDHVEQQSHMAPHFRVGWGNTSGYIPYPGGGEKWGGNGVGDDLYSYGFDGAYLWTGGRSTMVIPSVNEPYVKKGDNIGCALDLSVPIITFFYNGMKIPGYFRNFNLEGMFFPVISASAKISCRFLFGGEHGRLKYSPPEGFSPLYDCLLPTQILAIDPCFYFGEVSKGVLSGPLPVEDDVAYIPQPVDTSTIQLPSFVENIRDKLAENIHEMWAMGKIEAGWTHGERRDDTMGLHPCLTQFQNLPQAEKRYNVQLAVQTLRTIIALGYNISMDKPPARIRAVRLPNDPFLQSNGYKPAPLDLSAIELTTKMEELVDLLAENTHNLWAKERISQSWTYGLNEDSERKRSPHLLPYIYVDEAIKIANRNTASETVRTLLVYGYILDPPTGEIEATELKVSHHPTHRTYRAERTYGVSSGKWYYEVEVLTPGSVCVGWALTEACPDASLGGDESSWSYDGSKEEKLHGGVNDTYGKKWQVGDTIGVFLDTNDRTIVFSLNGELLVDPSAGDAAFSEIQGETFVPACTLGIGQKCRLNFGHDVDTFKYFTMCGLQEGYEPFCVNMVRAVTFWYTKELSSFENNEDLDAPKIDVTRMPAGADNPPSLKISHNTYEQEEKADWEFMRLSLPVSCNDRFILEQDKARRWQEIQMRQARQAGRGPQQPRRRGGPEDGPTPEMTSPQPASIDDEMLELINEYFYGVRVFPGQDSSMVYVGWVTTQYHFHTDDFSRDSVRSVTVQKLDNYGGIAESVERQNCYMMRVDEMYAEVSNDPSGKPPSTGLFVGCFIDVSTGFLSFTCEGKEIKQRFKMEPGTKLFPSVFLKASSKDALQFELGRTQTSLPLSAAVLVNSGKHIIPQFPQRLKVQCMKPKTWARVPNKNLVNHALKLSDIRGWSLLSEDPVSMLAIHIPEEDRCIDMLELIENERLASFHAQTLKLYAALCFQSNYKAMHAICAYCDRKQLLYAIQNEFMPGILRQAFFDILISLHLESYVSTVEITQKEFIVPMTETLMELYSEPDMGNSLRSLAYESIRPQMATCEITTDFSNIKELTLPEFALDSLREFVMEALENAVSVNQVANRDPIGGTNQDLFVPLIKLLDKLLMAGILSDEDVSRMLIMIHPQTWDENFQTSENSEHRKGILNMVIHEDVKLELCKLIHHMCDVQVRHRLESVVSFAYGYMGDLQSDQLRRYIEIKQSDMPSAVAAKKTKEFRCPPREQMNTILSFKTIEDEEELEEHPCNSDLRGRMSEFHDSLMSVMSIASLEAEDVVFPTANEVADKPSLLTSFSATLKAAQGDQEDAGSAEEPHIKSAEEKFRKVLVDTIIRWGSEAEIENRELIKEMFSLLLRQYDTVGELMKAAENSYIINSDTTEDVKDMWVALSRIRSLLPVQMSKEEEELVRELLWTLVNNHVFFQHPDLIRILKIHENVIAIMMNSIARSDQGGDGGGEAEEEGTPGEPIPTDTSDSSSEMVVACCRFLCYFCRTSRQNQKAMFDHLLFILDNANILLNRPSLRGSTPLDVAYSSLMDNTELALALREHYLEKIAVYLSRCGLTSNSELVSKGYPDLGWDPVEGERFMDFLRFCVWVGGESVEENANLVIRLLIRRPECLGPALQGEGEGLLSSIVNANNMSESVSNHIKAAENGHISNYRHPLPSSENDEDFIDTGAAILNFYCTLVDVLGRCAPDASVIAQGKNDSLRARAILRSLVPLEDLQGVLSLRFNLAMPMPGLESRKSDMPSGLIPNHKQSIALFMERVYGIEDRDLFFTILENAFLPDLRAATMLEKPEGGESEMGLALNRFIGNSILPALIKYNHYYSEAENYNPLLEATLHTVYQLSKGKMLTNVQRQSVSDFLITLTREVAPFMLLKLLRRLTTDLAKLNEYSSVALKMLTLFYERCSKYYGSPMGQGSYGCASDEEKKLSMALFSSIFDSLSNMEYDANLFGMALPCLTAIGSALPPDYAMVDHGDEDMFSKPGVVNDIGPYTPLPIDTSQANINNELNTLIQKFSEHYHDSWAQKRIDAGWTYGDRKDVGAKTHNRLKPYSMLSETEKETYREPIRDAVKSMLSLDWHIEYSEGGGQAPAHGGHDNNPHNYRPQPADMTNLTLSKEMMNLSERLAEDGHDIQALREKNDLNLRGGGPINLTLVPFDLLTESEKKKNRERCQELLKYIQFTGYNLYKTKRNEGDSLSDSKNPENRFAYRLLEKLISYLDTAASSMKILKPSANFTRRNSFSRPNKNVKFFVRVVLPLIEKYFGHTRHYFTAVATASSSAGVATIKEKEYVASLFCKLANLLRQKKSAFGADAPQAVRCLQILIKAVDARSLAKSRPDFVRTSMLTFFNNGASDLEKTIANLRQGKYPLLRGSHIKTCTSLKYIFDVLGPVFISTFDHLCALEYGQDLLVDEIQVACWRILESFFILGTDLQLTKAKKFIKTDIANYRSSIGTILSAISSTFPVAFLEPSLSKFNPHSVLGSGFSDRSLEAQEVTARFNSNVPELEQLVSKFDKYVEEINDYKEEPHVIDVILPLLCSYLPTWWSHGPDNVDPKGGSHITMVTSENLNVLLKIILKLIMKNAGNPEAEWMSRIALISTQIIINTSEELLKDPFLPLMEKIRTSTVKMMEKEENCRGYLKAAADDASQIEGEIQEEWNLIARDIYAFYPLLIKYVDLQRTYWIRNNIAEAETVYNAAGEIFNIMKESSYFKREELNFISSNELDPMSLIMPGNPRTRQPVVQEADKSSSSKKKKGKKAAATKTDATSLLVVALKRLLPVGLNLFAGKEQELVQHCKDKFLSQNEEEDITEFCKNQLTLPNKFDPSDALLWQHHLYSTLGNKQCVSADKMKTEELELLVNRIVAMGKVLYGLHVIDHPSIAGGKGSAPKVVSIQRKRAVIACFRQTSLHSLPKHAAINLFLKTYTDVWLNDENSGQEVIIDHLTMTFEEAEMKKSEPEEESASADQLTQLVHMFSQSAIMERSGDLPDDDLYMAYCDIMAKSCGGGEEEGGEEEEEGEGPSLQEQEIEKMRLEFNQGRLAERGVAEMVLNNITAGKGNASDMIEKTLGLGISILEGGNLDVQSQMLEILKEKKESGFFTSIAGLLASASVLNLDAFERNTKAEGLGVGPDGPAGEKNMHDAEFTTSLLRFLQLTSEGHNNDWQNYLRNQPGNPTIVNLVICTVDYLLRLQESIMDFYWYYSRKELIDPAGQSNFFTAIGVASQVFNTITEIIQGPCVGNQQALAMSRLWDAVGGFLFLFAHLQEKLSKNASQVDLLKEILNLQADMVVMLLSMLEGNVLNGTIGKQMVDTLVESTANVELILNYFKLFLSLPSEEEMDENGDGTVSPREMRDRLEATKNYTREEIEFLLLCCEENHEGKIDYVAFKDTFYEPSKAIGFNLAVLLTNLSEHMTNDPRLAKFLETAASVLNFFEAFLGRIEIKTADKVERVYFEIDEANIEQWEKPQIRESKNAFFHNCISEGEGERMEQFVDFCEDAIFEMQMAASLMATDEEVKTVKAAPSIPGEDEPRGIIAPLKENIALGISTVVNGIKMLHPANISAGIAKLKTMTPLEIVLGMFTLMFYCIYGVGLGTIWVNQIVFGTILKLMRGQQKEVQKTGAGEIASFKKAPIVEAKPSGPASEISTVHSNQPPSEAFASALGISDSLEKLAQEKKEKDDLAAQQEAAMKAAEDAKRKKAASTSSAAPSFNFGKYLKKMTSFLARNFFTMKFAALVIAFIINFMLLFYRVSQIEEDGEPIEDDGMGGLEMDIDEDSIGDDLAPPDDETALEVGDDGEGGDEEDVEEYIHVEERFYYLEYIISILGLIHALLSFCMLIAYYNLKIPLAIFKREKEVARKMEFDGIYISEQPEDDNLKGHWDKMVISAKSFPVNYWDKFVKKRVREKYSETFEFDALCEILGMEKSAIPAESSEETGIMATLKSIDWRYQVWQVGVTVTDNTFLYLLFYFIFSVLGNYNYFFFAAHLIDVAVGVPALRIILQAITHNGKQLVLTVMLLTIIVYIYTVIAFNFFRKFYVSEEEEGEPDAKCHDMLTCFVFHLYKGVRAGGGIGDEIEPPDGDDYEYVRILFDISFFFFVIVILLAIIQGFIIDAFGALRDQMQGVEDELENNCFICGIGKDYFDKVPHGFDIHVQKEHNLANYLFFVQYLIEKDENDYTGQETLVWDMYQNRCWDFFPQGDCFRKQYETELGGGGD
ncbi:ryanodine receptor isoform X3 [Eurytemora carolleeae]|uniref:ryanodine receptor isoform X3 n=1 Tax=Eurytemora carolleeae TaxID=1294199 RepID=UPI000C793727|nr:ryanodine receptor isoform X3 [Eurytemora carolleeae]|eukprot:XP_023320280.1 ryanodine receptor-like isoform X3 [Eurytemora affinis]